MRGVPTLPHPQPSLSPGPSPAVPLRLSPFPRTISSRLLPSKGERLFPGCILLALTATPSHILSPFLERSESPCPWLISTRLSGLISDWASSRKPSHSPSSPEGPPLGAPPCLVAALTPDLPGGIVIVSESSCSTRRTAFAGEDGNQGAPPRTRHFKHVIHLPGALLSSEHWLP